MFAPFSVVAQIALGLLSMICATQAPAETATHLSIQGHVQHVHYRLWTRQKAIGARTPCESNFQSTRSFITMSCRTCASLGTPTCVGGPTPSVPAYEGTEMVAPGHLHFGKCLGIHGLALPNQAVEAQ